MTKFQEALLASIGDRLNPEYAEVVAAGLTVEQSGSRVSVEIDGEDGAVTVSGQPKAVAPVVAGQLVEHAPATFRQGDQATPEKPEESPQKGQQRTNWDAMREQAKARQGTHAEPQAVRQRRAMLLGQ